MNATGFPAWMQTQLEAGVETLVIGGCTTTSCVRVSSQAVHQAYCDRLRVVVDLSLCGARLENYNPVHAAKDPVLIDLYGAELDGRSAVDLAVLQMMESGVEVVDSCFPILAKTTKVYPMPATKDAKEKIRNITYSE